MSKITVLIPVYNAPKAVDFLLKSLRDNTNRSLVDQIIIGNDNSDAATSSLIDALTEDDELFLHIKRETNLGFLGNVNDLFKRASGEIVVLLNSDTILPYGWAERVLAAFESDPAIGLACPLTTNATNLVLKPAPGQHWIDVDRMIATTDQLDCCTGSALTKSSRRAELLPG
ncbi:glycosyltransferase family 2 protein [Brucella oryzae]|uniref:glycosyltransferase family 2 protein n=1 Tax=Brucella oryzae TaxID=335286 RepID=UPI001B8339B6|nr:glycosyltransferase family 2 protein [Brucella oryzae]MBR7653293.1 glycosyltransferase family 2 protein [Brucella oryzae]